MKVGFIVVEAIIRNCASPTSVNVEQKRGAP
jgi:hypothetical protein